MGGRGKQTPSLIVSKGEGSGEFISPLFLAPLAPQSIGAAPALGEAPGRTCHLLKSDGDTSPAGTQADDGEENHPGVSPLDSSPCEHSG